ncbi:MAG: hypothetical protein NTY38_03715 [Acidobacteria bacterium]|nr:hypothetical protein [Acidobacteriota bacterium]
MKILNGDWLAVASLCAVVLFHTWAVFRRLWREPLKHGTAYFMGVAVDPGFYESSGAQWMRRYHTALLVQYTILVGGFAVMVALGYWRQLPLLVPVHVISFFGLVGGVALWARRRLNTHPPVLERVAVDFTPRRLADYISWPLEALMLAVLAASWLLLNPARPHFDWSFPIVITYIVMAMLPGKILIVRNRLPLPAEKTEEHRRFDEALRRHALRQLDGMRWMALSIFAVVAVHKAVPALKNLLVPSMAIPLAAWLVMMAVIIRGTGRLNAMSAGLRPMGSWKSPFLKQPRSYLVWISLYCACLIALLLYFRG